MNHLCLAILLGGCLCCAANNSVAQNTPTPSTPQSAQLSTAPSDPASPGPANLPPTTRFGSTPTHPTLLPFVNSSINQADDSLPATAIATLNRQLPTSLKSNSAANPTKITPQSQTHLAADMTASNGLVERVVRMFDFEERLANNFESMPMHWFILDPNKTPGFPAYTQAGFDDTFASSGDHSFKLQLNGGSAAVRLETGTIAAIPGARYLITGRVRTEDVDFSRARIVAMFVDQNGALAPNGRHTSELAVSNNMWTSLRIDLPDAPDQAAWIVLRLELIQPIEYQTRAPRAHEVVREDIHAAAWFDDVAVYQMPLIELTTQSPMNVIRRPDQPQLHVRVQDLTGDPLEISVVLYDMNRQEVARREQPLDRNNPGEWDWNPGLEKLGWYWASLEVSRPGGATVGRSLTAFAWLNPETGRGLSEADRFMVVAEGMSTQERSLVDQIMQSMGNQAISLPIWTEIMDEDALDKTIAGYDPAVTRLLESGRSVVLSLHGVPKHLAIEVDTDSDKPFSLFMTNRGTWQSYLEALLAVYGHEVRDWQIGPADATEAMELNDLGGVYGNVLAKLGRFVTEPKVLTPWAASMQLTAHANQATGLMMRLPISVRPELIPTYAQSWPSSNADSTGTQITLLLDTLPPDLFYHEARTTDLALRMIWAWQVQPGRIALRRPWGMFKKHEAEVLPDALLAVWANVSSQLAGRRFVGRMNLGEGVETYLLDGPGGGVLVAWADDTEHATGSLDLYLGKSPVLRDIFGNVTPLRREGNKQHLDVTQTPVFIEGIDMRLARFRTGFTVEPPTVESIHASHKRILRITNPWPQTITGKFHIDEPKRWNIQPKLNYFSIAGGQTKEIEIEMTLPISVLASEHQLEAHFEMEADQPYVLDLKTPVTVGLKDIEFKVVMDIETREGYIDPVVVLEMEVTNIGAQDYSFYGFAKPFAQQEVQKLVAPIRPGQTIIKRFVFFEKFNEMVGQPMRVGLRQINGPAMLNEILTVPILE